MEGFKFGMVFVTPGMKFGAEGLEVPPGAYLGVSGGGKRGLYEMVDGYPGKLVLEWEEKIQIPKDAISNCQDMFCDRYPDGDTYCKHDLQAAVQWMRDECLKAHISRCDRCVYRLECVERNDILKIGAAS